MIYIYKPKKQFHRHVSTTRLFILRCIMSETKKLTSSLADLNNLSKFSYTLPSEQKLILQRRRPTFLSQIKEYLPEDTIQLDFGSRHEFMNAPSSTFNFTVMFDQKAGQEANRPEFKELYDGSACNFLSDFKLTAKSQELEFTKGLDGLTYIKDQYACSQGYLGTTGTLQGYKRGSLGSDSKTDTTTRHDFSVPFHHISQFLSQEVYLPLPQIGKFTLEIKLNSLVKSMKMNALVEGTTYRVTNVKVIADLYRPNDMVLAAAWDTSRKGLMMLTYDNYYYNKAVIPEGLTTSMIEIKQAVSRAMSVISRVRDGANEASDGKRVTQASKEWDTNTQWQYTLGSETYPVRPVLTSVESMAMGLDAFHVLDNCLRPPSVSYSTFNSNGVNSGSLAIMAADLERDVSAPESSAVSTKENNRVMLEITTTGAAAAAGGTFVETWLHHLLIASILPDSISVKK